MSLGRSLKLNSGHSIPAIGLGTWLSKPHKVENAVEAALRNEVGNGWKKSGVPRDQIFITSKLWNTHHNPDHVEEALHKTLKYLQMYYLDLYLHTNETLTPIDPITKRFRLADVRIADTWKALEKLVHSGKIKSIGVSNFTIEKLEELLKTAEIPPAEIAADLNKDPAAVLLSWAVQRGTAVLPKSVTLSRIESNFKDFIIPDSEFEALNKLDRNQRYEHAAKQREAA
ncbi:NADP-dependent oxidoreductase domain-containing protein [Aspergillus recurvatus]